MSYKTKMTIDDLDMRGKQVLVRVDYNVPIENGVIQDDKRIRATLPTLRKILDSGGLAVLMSHRGRPKGKRDSALSLAPVAKRLSELLGKNVTFVPDCIGEKAKDVRSKGVPGDIILLENLRFHAGEKDNDEEFARQLADGADIYINDAFATSHRKHASMVAVTKFVKQAAAGYLLLREMEMLEGVIAEPNRPFVAIIGGIKLSTKIGVIYNLLDRCDKLLIGGAMACPFFESLGIMPKTPSFEQNDLGTVRQILEKADSSGSNKLIFPIDAVVTDKIAPEGRSVVSSFENIPEGLMIVDIGPDTVALYRKQLESAQTIIMNGPLGAFEVDKFSHGTREIMKVLVERAEAGATVVIGGGDTASAAKRFGVDSRMTHVSTGGGALLEVLEGKSLPAIEALTERM
ncbi:phosphoglycerate kinase [bacterium]|nr:phosphoglycerate kinase [bacterium]